ncbi:MAG TPA: FecR domain-containing protein [Verrucomicrobiae bacterium]
MKSSFPNQLSSSVIWLLAAVSSWVLVLSGQAQSARLVSVEGSVSWQRDGSTVWQPAQTNLALNVGDRVRTGVRSRAAIQFTDRSVKRLFESSIFRLDSPGTNSAAAYQMESGKGFFKSAEPAGRIQIRTRTVSATIRGTEFQIEIAEDGTTKLALIDGLVDLENPSGELSLAAHEIALAKPGAPPQKLPGLFTQGMVQWCLYYPGVLDLAELPLDSTQRQTLSLSMAAWKAGDLAGALQAWPADRRPKGDAEKVYLAALLLTVGQIENAETLLSEASASSDEMIVKLAWAQKTLIAAVRFEAIGLPYTPATASEWLAMSYWRQSAGNLPAALEAAQQSAKMSLDFGLAHGRVAELEFSFGRITKARQSIETAHNLSPRNAQSVAVRGFLQAANGRLKEAALDFDRAIALNGASGNAWLGRGLIKIRQGDLSGGRADLQIAASLEPNRSLLRSYLGKAFHVEGDIAHALSELKLAREFDPQDPTPWLYSSLLARERNRLNQSVDDLEHSSQLNANRALFRSRLLLDQDQAVRSANLAKVYRDVNMMDVAVSEAGKAVSADFANHSAHLFLANSFIALQEARRSDLRYETPALNELLLANLLAPPGAPVLSSTISQQEYSSLFEQDGPGFFSQSEYRSSGDWSQTASHYGRYGRMSYALDYGHTFINGEQPNGRLERDSFSAQIKQQLSSKDSIFAQVIHTRSRAGDLTSYYNPASANPGVRQREILQPTVISGLHREWSPGIHTLLLAGRVEDELTYSNPTTSQLLLARTAPGGPVFAVGQPAFPTAALAYDGRFTLYTGELLQLFQREKHTDILGLRYQQGTFDASSALSASTAVRLGNTTTFFPPFPPITFSTPASAQSQSVPFDRFSAYYYHHWQVWEPLRLIGGLSYDQVGYPDNHLFPPLQSTTSRRDKVSPKAGLVWTPDARTTVQFGFARAISGASFDQSFRLEPSEVAGFNQSYRSVIPDSVAGTTQNADFETYGLSLHRSFPTRTHLTLALTRITSETSRQVGSYDIALPPATPSSTREELRYREHTLTASLNQLLGDDWHTSLRYTLSDARLQDDFPEIPATVTTLAHTVREATLQKLNLHLGYQHRIGFFARAEGDWYCQSNRGSSAATMPGDEFWQINLHTGWRFARRQAELQVSLLNLAGQDYRLNPLNFYASLPRERTLAMHLKLNF